MHDITLVYTMLKVLLRLPNQPATTFTVYKLLFALKSLAVVLAVIRLHSCQSNGKEILP